MLCDSVKVKDPMKVGRFGLGFKSVFHMTGKDPTAHDEVKLFEWVTSTFN